MKNSKTWLSSMVILGLFAVSVPAFAEHTRVTNPNAVGFELLGRGLLYSLTFDRVLSDDLVAGFGYGTVGTEYKTGGDAGITAKLIPAYVNYYFTRDQGSLYVTGGVTVVANSGDTKEKKAATSGLEFSSNAFLPTLGVGYENRSDYGFLVRFGGYAIVGAAVRPWLGFSFGYAF